MALHHPPDVLREMADDHVAYELDRMARWAKVATRDDEVNAALLEAYLIHVRNVTEFVTKACDKKTRRDTMLAVDYFVGPWTLSKGPPLTDAQLMNIHCRIAHLSTRRLARPGGPFDWAGNGRLDLWATRVLRSFGRFLGDLRAEDAARASWFKPGYDNARRILRS